MSRPDLRAPSWHASPALVTAYAAGRAGPVDAASLEAHLTGCPVCRAELSLAVVDQDKLLLAQVRGRVVDRAPLATRPRRARLPSAVPPHLRIVVRGEALVAVLLAVAGAFLLDLLARHLSGVGPLSTGGGVIRLLAPAVPLAGVALCSTRAGDPCREAVLASSTTGLRLTLWRTVTVLVVALPLTAASTLARDVGAPWLWLLPCLALTTTTLAAGTVVDLTRAAGAVAAGWCLLAIGPSLRGLGDATSVLARLDAGRPPAVLAGSGAQFSWVLLAVAASVFLVARRDRYSWLGTPVARSLG